MPRIPSLKTTLFVVAGILIIGLPILLYFFTHPRETVLFPTLLNRERPEVSEQFRVESQLPGYTLTLADTRFLDYAAATIDIFSPNAIADPRYWSKAISVSQRVTVTRVKLVLVEQVSNPIGFVVNLKTATMSCRLIRNDELSVLT